MSSDSFRCGLRNFILDLTPKSISIAQVMSVDETALTCMVKELGYDFEISVRLNAGKTTKKVVLIPKVESFVLIGLIGNSEQARYVASVSEIEKVYVDANTSVVFNGGENGGLCITPTLKTELDKNNQILTAILNILNGAPIAEPGNGSPSALQASLKGAVTGKTVGNFSNIENTKVKH